jgi:hypothetical protein
MDSSSSIFRKEGHSALVRCALRVPRGKIAKKVVDPSKFFSSFWLVEKNKKKREKRMLKSFSEL